MKIDKLHKLDSKNGNNQSVWKQIHIIGESNTQKQVYLFVVLQVRADYQRCRPKSRAYCNCAVAVKSGDDVITIAGCQDNNNHGHGIGQIMQQLFGHRHGHGHDHGHARTPMTIQMYINGQLTPGTVVRRFGCGQKYEVPTCYFSCHIKLFILTIINTKKSCAFYEKQIMNKIDENNNDRPIHYR